MDNSKKIRKKNAEVIVLGVMSGTSLDGIDLALCGFSGSVSDPAFRILKARTVAYPAIWKQRLESLPGASAEKYFALDTLYAQFVAKQINVFLEKSVIRPRAIASHGHTVFHQPHAGFTTQAGNGAVIAAHTGITTICDFRSVDVALKGQGAPLVPLGDQLLFGSYDACLNLGGIANISFEKKGKRIAYDICVANMLLNYLSEGMGADYDEDGKIAESGVVDKTLLGAVNGLDYFKKAGAKSIGREWFEKNLLKTFERSGLSTEDKLATATEHIAYMIGKELGKAKSTTVLATGGGAFNKFLVSEIRKKSRVEIVLPEPELINFKEALIFAFLGYLRLYGITNTMASVTGAVRDSIAGAVYAGEQE